MKEYTKFISEYFIINGIDIGPYTSRNIVKRYIFFERLSVCLDMLNKNINKDINPIALNQAKKLLDQFNENFKTRSFEVLNSLLNMGYKLKAKKSNYSLFMTYYLSRSQI